MSLLQRKYLYDKKPKKTPKSIFKLHLDILSKHKIYLEKMSK